MEEPGAPFGDYYRGIYARGLAARRLRCRSIGASSRRGPRRRWTRGPPPTSMRGRGWGRRCEANRAAFERVRIVPRMLRDVAERDLSLGADAVLLGRPYVWGLALEGERGWRRC